MDTSIFGNVPVLNGSTYSKMVVLKEQTPKAHAALVARLKSDGYEEIATGIHSSLNCGAYKKDGETVTLMRSPSDGCLRVAWESEEKNSAELLTPPADIADGAVTLSQIGVSGYGVFKDCPMIGMFYLIRLSDGRALIIDGGFPTDGSTADILKALEGHGIAKDGAGRYKIAAWVLTHAHPDHIGAFHLFGEQYADRVRLEHALYNFPGDDRVAMGGDPDIPKVERAIDGCFEGCKRVVPRGGLTYRIGNAKLRMLVSGDMHYSAEKRLKDHNDTSLTFILEAEGVRVLFLGDGGEETARKILECYSAEELKCDIVQIPHHGLFTGSPDILYTAEERRAMTKREKSAWWAERFANEHLTRLYEAASPTVGLLPMGDVSVNPKGGRRGLLELWNGQYGQIAHFLGKRGEPIDYDEVNIIRNGELTTYLMSSNEEPMITRFELRDGKLTMLSNQSLQRFKGEI